MKSCWRGLRLFFDFANGGKRARIFVGQIRKRKKRAAFGWFSANTLSKKKKNRIHHFRDFRKASCPPSPPSKLEKKAAKVLLSIS